MTTIKLKISDNILHRVMALLRQFKPEELEIIEASESFITNQKSLRQELALVESGKSKSISLEKLDEILDKAIREYED